MRAALPIGRTGLVRILLAAVLVTMSASACASSGDSDSDGDGSASSCAYLVEYQNHTYSGAEAKGFTVGRRLGAASLPPCDDTPNDGSSDGEAAQTPATAYEIAGVDPEVAIALEQKGGDVIFVNADSGKKLPEIKKLIKAS